MLALSVALTVAVAPGDPAPARCYVVLLGGQAGRFRPQTAHTFATFVRAAPGQPLDPFTISWLPDDMTVRPFRLRPEPGRNFTLIETLDKLNTPRGELSMWGPFKIPETWFADARRYKATLDSGAIRFRTFDRGDRRPDLNHCVHAITYTDPALKAAAAPVTWYGELVTRKVAGAMATSGVVPEPFVTHDWLIPALGLDRYPLTRRTVGEPVLKFLR